MSVLELLGYTYDFKDTVVKGLTVTARHYDGSNIQNNNGTRGKEQEDNLIVNYVVPEGKLKGLGFQWMYINVNYAQKQLCRFARKSSSNNI